TAADEIYTLSLHDALPISHRGLSGPSSLQLSNYWDVGQRFNINFLPYINLVDFFKSKKTSQPKVLLRTLLNEHLPKSVVLELQTDRKSTRLNSSHVKISYA